MIRRTALVPFFSLLAVFFLLPAAAQETPPDPVSTETQGSETGEPAPDTGETSPEPVPEALPDSEASSSETAAPAGTPAASSAVTETAPTVPSEEPTAETLPEETVSLEETPVESVDYSGDYQLYKKYLLFQKYEKRELYRQYARYQQLAGRYPWENAKAEKKALKKLKSDYKKSKKKKYRKSPQKYPALFARAADYQDYGALKAEYFSLKPYAGYAHYAGFNREEYTEYQKYGTEAYKGGFERYKKALGEGKVKDKGDADLDATDLGPEITVGIFNYTTKDLRENSLSIAANQPFDVRDKKGQVLAAVAADTKIKVKYDGDKKLRVYYSGSDAEIGKISKEVHFVGTGEAPQNIIFDLSRPGSSFDHYRGTIRLRYYDSPEADGDRIWVINALPLEHYVWGMGEITGTGPAEYNRVMTTIFRTYGYWKIKWSTKYADQGFKVDATPGNQLYHGYDWEKSHQTIKEAALATRGKLVMYDREVALTPYSSWTDGATRRFEDGHWGRACATEKSKTSALYPWLSAVGDPRGKHESKKTCELAATGNHMVGLSANGAVRMAKHDGKTFDQILTHFYGGVDLIEGY